MNAFVPGQHVEVAPTANGALDGLRFAVKDLIDIAGFHTGGGNPDWLVTHAPAERHAACVSRLLGAGARVDGKTITDELAYSLEGENYHYGTPLNPRWPHALPGGSSSGSASAVAAGRVDFALGTDTGGSVRVPAAFCGVWGIRPTHDAVSLDGVLPFAPCFDTVGWFARSADVLARVGRVLLTADTSTGASSSASPGASPMHGRRRMQVKEAFDLRATNAPNDAARLRLLAQSIGAVDSVAVTTDGEWLACYQALQDADIDTSLSAWIVSTKPRFGPSIAPRFARLDKVERSMTTHWRETRARLRARLDALMQDTLLIMPTTPVALLAKNTPGDTIGRFYEDALTMNAIAAIGGLPQITLPFFDEIDRPLALSIIGARGDDLALLALAQELSARFGSADGVLYSMEL
jgi:amidase